MNPADRNSFVRAVRALVALVAAMCVSPGALAQLQVAGAPLRARTAAGEEMSLPLVEESVKVEIDQQHATTVVQRVYHNASGQRVEGQFAFRAGDETNVAGFAYWNGEQKIVGEVMETWAARKVYSTTLQRRRDPGLLEKTERGASRSRSSPSRRASGRRSRSPSTAGCRGGIAPSSTASPWPSRGPRWTS